MVVLLLAFDKTIYWAYIQSIIIAATTQYANITPTYTVYTKNSVSMVSFAYMCILCLCQ